MSTLFLLDGYLYSGALQYTSIAQTLAGAATTVVTIPYNNLLTTNANMLAAADMLDDYLTNGAYAGEKTVCAISMGAQVADLWLRDYGPTSAISPSDLSFVLLANPESNYCGSVQYNQYGGGHGIPTGTPYTVTDFARQYDGVADFPNVPTSSYYGLATINGYIGMGAIHMFYWYESLTASTNLTYTAGNITYVLSPTRPWWLPDYALPLIETAYNRPYSTAPEPPPAPTPPPLPPGAAVTTSPLATSVGTAASAGLTTRYPTGQITPAGAYHVLAGDQPMLAYRSYDNTCVFHLMGGLAIPDPMTPEAIRLHDLKGLIPPWKNITQKGASQDGASYVTSLYDPMEVDMTVSARGRDPNYTRKLINTWVRSWDAKQAGELSFFTPQQGRWWAPVRWSKQPLDKFQGGTYTHQQFGWTATAYDAFWRSYDDVDEFRFSYADDSDDFNYSTNPGLGAGWTVAYTGTGAGNIYADGFEALWSESGTGSRRVTCQRVGYTSTTNNQVVSITLGTFPEWHLFDTALNDVWARMKSSGTVGDEGVRLRFGIGIVRISYFIGGVETVIRQRPLLIPPLPGETWTLIAGVEGDDTLGYEAAPRTFTVMRGGAAIMTVVEKGTGSPMGPNNRCAGFGMEAGGGLWDQASPAAVWSWSAGDNSTVAQSGFLTRINCGDQPAWDRLTLYGPGTFTIGDGPAATSSVTYGPLLPNQVVQIRTDPRRRAVVDLSSKPPTPQQLTLFQQALKDFISWATGNNVPPLLSEIESLFGIQPPQGNLFSLMDGRFSVPIPAQSPGRAAERYKVPVSIDDGNANSKIVAALTPLRRYPY